MWWHFFNEDEVHSPVSLSERFTVSPQQYTGGQLSRDPDFPTLPGYIPEGLVLTLLWEPLPLCEVQLF